ncbi:MAG: PDZ domain-containing protein [Polyangiaceae bacterium]|nr:PDZ domain-containing protein [Polyangiaceae bacterium]
MHRIAFRASRSVAALTLTLAALSPSLWGCSPAQTPEANDPAKATNRTLADLNADRAEFPPLKVSDPLPPTPVPSTFDVADLAERVKPTVVNITTTQRVNLPDGHPFEFFFGPDGRVPPGERTGAGTGFIIDPQGYVITNEHVVREADEVMVRLSDERDFAATVVGRDPKLDLALLKLKDAKNLPAVHLGSSGALRIGEHVLAVGNPFGLGHTVTLGIVSAKSRAIGAGPYDDFIQTDASINPGNSGGPLFNWRGEVVGINTAIRPDANNIGFAIPVDDLKGIIQQLRDKGHVVRGKLGLVFQPISADLAKALHLDGPKGALVAQIEPAGAAARAGIKAGDVIVAVNDIDILHAEELPRQVAKNSPGAQIKLAYLRAGKKGEATAKLDTLEDDTLPPPLKPKPAPEEPKNNQLGVQVSNTKNNDGVRIDGLSPTTSLKEARPGDVIVEVDGKPVKDVDQLEKLLSSATKGAVLLAKVRRGDLSRFMPIPIPEKDATK